MELISVTGKQKIIIPTGKTDSSLSLHTQCYDSIEVFFSDFRKKGFSKKPLFLLVSDLGLIGMDPEATSVILLQLLSRYRFPIHVHLVTRKKESFLAFKKTFSSDKAFPLGDLFSADYISAPFITSSEIRKSVIVPLTLFLDHGAVNACESADAYKSDHPHAAENSHDAEIAHEAVSAHRSERPSRLKIFPPLSTPSCPKDHEQKADIALWGSNPDIVHSGVAFLQITHVSKGLLIKNPKDLVILAALPEMWNEKGWELLYIFIGDTIEEQMEVQSWLLYAEKRFSAKEFQKKIKILLPGEGKDSFLIISPIKFLNGGGCLDL